MEQSTKVRITTPVQASDLDDRWADAAYAELPTTDVAEAELVAAHADGSIDVRRTNVPEVGIMGAPIRGEVWTVTPADLAVGTVAESVRPTNPDACPACGNDDDDMLSHREDDTMSCSICGLIWHPERGTWLEAVPFQWVEHPLSELAR